MSEEKKPAGSKLKKEPEEGMIIIGSTVPVQVISGDKEIKAALPTVFTENQKEVKKFLCKVQLYITLNPKAFKDDRMKKLFLLFYMKDGPGEFWKNQKIDELLENDPTAEAVTWGDFIEDFKVSFKPLNVVLNAQMKLQDLKMKEQADEYMYQFQHLAKQMEYNNMAQIEAFKRGLPRGLIIKVMTRPEGKLDNIKDWMNTAILFDETWKQAIEYRRKWNEDNGRALKP
ncbi:hypothetical protein Moror_2191 [Moniliophthora roreri MCA 2997]|uniref:Retrotransposon gag domain-containing protein n=2 Tax=Moniliophthora roreri TaxID=221103 RepID=V2W3W4_MONRO|nr:hypothetical protein Moror_2191 [Moniliophthora roreri MCA 2997]KAI3604027.1 hypothetical protein WG66_000852 [Moniliophthora roreri]